MLRANNVVLSLLGLLAVVALCQPVAAQEVAAEAGEEVEGGALVAPTEGAETPPPAPLEEASSQPSVQGDALGASSVDDATGTPAMGTLKVISAPAGAKVAISNTKSGDGQPIGETPLDMKLKPWTYWVTVTKAHHRDHQEQLTLKAGQETSLDLDLEFDPWTALKVTSVVTFWTGVAAGILGGVGGYLGWHYANQYDEELDEDVADTARLWTGIMYGGGGAAVALLTIGIICYLVNKKKEKAVLATLGLVPSDEGAVLSMGRRF